MAESLVYTPTWAIASTCSVFILSSLIVERTIFYLGHLIVKYKQTALQEAFEKIKEELMLVGFISLALTLGQSRFEKICMPIKWSTVMPLCKKPEATADTTINAQTLFKRILATDATTQTCKGDDDATPFIASEGFHQLHILIFMLVIFHVTYTLLIVALGMWTVNHWKAWEERANSKEMLSAHGGVRYTRETSFVRAHAARKWRTNIFLSYVGAFFQQFYNSVTETDYHTLRHGFIKNHMPGNAAFDFHKYIRRSLQDDFKYVVGISPGLWGYAILWMLFNVDGLTTHISVTFIPLILVLAIGTKLQYIVTKMAIQINKKHPIISGMPDVKPNDRLFWFNRPRFILQCIHFILFQNALEISFNLWAAFTFSPDTCLYRHPYFLIGRLIVGIFVQMACGIITLPIYALVSQMGSSVKKTIFEEHIQLAIGRWHRRATENSHKGEESSRSSHSHHRPSAPASGGDVGSSLQNSTSPSAHGISARHVSRV